MKFRVYQFHGLKYCKGHGRIDNSISIKQYIDIFCVRGIVIMSIHAYNEFEKVWKLLRKIHFEIDARIEHVGDIEREVRTLKEKCRCTTASVLYKHMPRIMMEANLEYKVQWNIFIPKYYISQAFRPQGMILGQDKLDYYNLKMDFGQYFQSIWKD